MSVSSLSSRFANLWERLIEPAPTVVDAVAQRKSRLLAAITLVLFASNFALLILFAVIGRDTAVIGNRTLTISACLVFLVLVFGLSHWGYYRAGGLLSIAVGTGLIFVLHFAGDGIPPTEFDYLVILTIFSTLFFSVQTSVIVFIIHALMMAGVTILRPNVSLITMAEGPISFNTLTVALIIGFSLYRDRVERKQQYQLTESERRYRALSELMSDYAYYYRMGPNGELQQDWITADSYKRLTGYEAEDRPHQSTYYLYHPDDAERVQHDIQIVRRGEPVRGEYRILTADGRLRWLNIFRRPDIDPATGRVIGFYGLAQDITERKQSEDVERKAALLQVALQKERELNTLKNQMMITISHEFRTPLATIQSSAELLGLYLDHLNPQQRRERLDTIRAQIRHLAALLDDIGFMVQSTYRPSVLETTPADLNALCAARVLEAQHHAPPGQKFMYAGDERLNNICIDVRLFTRILDNLLSNASKYSPEDGDIRVGLKLENEEIVLQVSDKGIGIAPEDQERMYQPFFRGGNTQNFQGTGFGLSIVNDCVAQLGGTIAVNSQLGQGAQFTVQLPLHPPALHTSASDTQETHAVQHRQAGAGS